MTVGSAWLGANCWCKHCKTVNPDGCMVPLHHARVARGARRGTAMFSYIHYCTLYNTEKRLYTKSVTRPTRKSSKSTLWENINQSSGCLYHRTLNMFSSPQCSCRRYWGVWIRSRYTTGTLTSSRWVYTGSKALTDSRTAAGVIVHGRVTADSR